MTKVGVLPMNDTEALKLAADVRRRRFRGLIHRKTVLLLFALVGSAASLVPLAYHAGSAWSFDVTSAPHYVVLAFVLAALLAFALELREDLSQYRPQHVTRIELAGLVHCARRNAVGGAVSFSGDVSWLRDEAPLLGTLRAKNISVQIFHTPTTLSHETLMAVSESVVLCSYDFVADARYLYLKVGDEREELYRIEKLASAPDAHPSQHKFLWQQLDPKESYTRFALATFRWLIAKHVRPPLRIGIIGANDVGKTTMANALFARLRDRLATDVRLYPDIFKKDIGGVSAQDNRNMLAAQLDAEAGAPPDTVCLFDRTSLDNYAFFRIRHPKEDHYFSRREVSRSIRSFDLFFDLHVDGNDYSLDTTHTSGAVRADARRLISDLLAESGVPVHKITLDKLSPSATEDDRHRMQATRLDAVETQVMLAISGRHQRRKNTPIATAVSDGSVGQR